MNAPPLHRVAWTLAVAAALGLIGLELRALARQAASALPSGRAEAVSFEGATAPEVLPGTDPAGDGTFRFVIAPVFSPERSMARYRALTDTLGARLGRRAIALQRPSYGEVNDLLRFHLADAAMVCSYAYVRGAREWGMEALVIPQIHERIVYHSHILVPTDSAARTLDDLVGRRFAVTDVLSTSGWLYPATWLIERGQDPTRSFRQLVFTGSHDRSLQAVADGQVDGAAVDSLVYEQLVADDPSVGQRIRVLQTSQFYGMPPIVVHPRIDPALRRALSEALTTMHTTPEGREILAPLGIDRFITPAPELYRSVAEAARIWESYR